MKHSFSLMFGALAVALTTMTSCSEDAIDEPANGSDAALTVVGTVDGMPNSRASDSSWEAGDAIGLVSTGIASNEKYVTSGGNGVFSAADAGVFFSDRSSHVFYAYYPYSPDVESGNLVFNVCDEANADAQKCNDIMVANGTASSSKPTLQLEFKHAMARIIINVKASTDDGFEADDVFDENCSAVLNSLCTTCTLGVQSSVVKASNQNDLYLVAPTDDLENHVRKYVVYVAPQAGRKFSMAFNRDAANQQTYSVQLSDDPWKAGQSYTYNVVLKRSGLDLSSASTITDWTSSDGDLDADMNN